VRRIEVSQAVWDEIAKHGKFAETEDDVLRRLLKLPAATQSTRRQSSNSSNASRRSTGAQARERLATTRMSSYVQNGALVVEFAGGPRKSFSLPNREDKSSLRRKRDEAAEFARASGASYGQEMAVKKALTEAGYHLVK
jgi:hypothetical protein